MKKLLLTDDRLDFPIGLIYSLFYSKEQQKRLNLSQNLFKNKKKPNTINLLILGTKITFISYDSFIERIAKHKSISHINSRASLITYFEQRKLQEQSSLPTIGSDYAAACYSTLILRFYQFYLVSVIRNYWQDKLLNKFNRKNYISLKDLSQIESQLKHEVYMEMYNFLFIDPEKHTSSRSVKRLRKIFEKNKNYQINDGYFMHTYMSLVNQLIQHTYLKNSILMPNNPYITLSQDFSYLTKEEITKLMEDMPK